MSDATCPARPQRRGETAARQRVHAIEDGLRFLVVASLCALAALFAALFLGPALAHVPRLARILRGLRRLPPEAGPEQIAPLFARDRRLAALWQQYAEGLHAPQPGAQGSAARLRASAPAES